MGNYQTIGPISGCYSNYLCDSYNGSPNQSNFCEKKNLCNNLKCFNIQNQNTLLISFLDQNRLIFDVRFTYFVRKHYKGHYIHSYTYYQ
jgi:hypothetical protein